MIIFARRIWRRIVANDQMFADEAGTIMFADESGTPLFWR